VTTMTLTARPIETRLRPLYATGFILGALLSACVAPYASLRLEYFLTIPFTCCAFFTLRRFREPTLHRKPPEPKLSGHLGQIVRAVLMVAFGTLTVSLGLFVKATPVIIVAQTTAIIGVTVLTIALARYLHDAMPSNIRAGSSSVVSTIGYGVFIPAALGFGLTARSHGIFEASAFVVGALIVMCATVSMMVKRQ
jgi:hypothetical protein